MSNSIIIGQYVPGNSLVHRLDPRTKITIVVFFIVIIFFANSLISYGILAAFALLSVILSKVAPSFIWKGLKPIWFIILFTFLLHLFLTKDGEVVFRIWNWEIYSGALLKGLEISLRFLLLVLMTTLLTLTTTPIAITDAVESMLNKLKKIRFPVHEIALMMSIALRFIPTLMQETDKISKAQASRGVDFRTGPMKERIKAVVPLLVPLFVSAFKRAEELAMAMEARGYNGGEGRTKFRELKLKRLDAIVFIISVIVLIVFWIFRG